VLTNPYEPPKEVSGPKKRIRFSPWLTFLSGASVGAGLLYAVGSAIQSLEWLRGFAYALPLLLAAWVLTGLVYLIKAV
jgi:hypothetical protein